LRVAAEIILYMVYFSQAVRDVLSNASHDRWMGRRGLTSWLPRSLCSNFNPLDSYLWGHSRTPCVCKEHIVDALSGYPELPQYP
jgi:hypothetical protein